VDTVEVEVDSRGRISLGRIAGTRHARYRVTRLDGGELVLTPVVSISERELALLSNPDAAEKLRRAIKQAETGEIVGFGPGHFSKLVEHMGDDPED
jgi:hypothetical protein